MDEESLRKVAHLIRGERIAALGTLLSGAPLVSMVPFSASADFSGFDIHVSRLAQHTQCLLDEPRVGLLIAEPDRPTRNPQTLSRLSLQGRAHSLPRESAEFEAAREAYLAKFPQSALNFQLGDFLLFRIRPISARVVLGFGKIFDLSPEQLCQMAGLWSN